MPHLNLDCPEPLAATLSVMLYPGTDEEDACKVQAFATHFLAEHFRRFRDAGHSLSDEAMAQLLANAGERVSFLAPDITRDILHGRQPAALTARRLMSDTRAPIDWDEQRAQISSS